MSSGTENPTATQGKAFWWNLPFFNVPWGGTEVTGPEPQNPEKKGILQRFTEFSDMQRTFIEKQPLVAAVYILAGVFFGFPHLLSFNPFSFIYGALSLYFASAIAWNVWNTIGPSNFVSQVVAEFRAQTTSEEKKAKKGES